MARDGLLLAQMLLLATPLGCEAEVVRDHTGPGKGSASGGHGGESAEIIDPAAECAGLGLLMDQLEGCKELWAEAPCTTDLEFALEFGCLEETLANLRCLASTCENAEVCRPEGDAYVQCHEERRAEDG